MPHDPRITIRLTPRQIKALRAVVQAFSDNPTTAALIGLGHEEIALARETLMHLPVLVPSANADNQQPATSNQ